jgi:hypothetical protein
MSATAFEQAMRSFARARMADDCGSMAERFQQRAVPECRPTETPWTSGGGNSLLACWLSEQLGAGSERRGEIVSSHYPIIFLVDVDNTLIDNDRIQRDLKEHLERAFGAAACRRYWKILENLFAELGYRDCIGALQRYCAEHPRDVELLSLSSTSWTILFVTGCSRMPLRC